MSNNKVIQPTKAEMIQLLGEAFLLLAVQEETQEVTNKGPKIYTTYLHFLQFTT